MAKCEDVDIVQLEQEALNVVENVQDFMVNIDLTNSQYNLQSLYEEAQKLGMDIDDLREYGFDDKAMKCAGTSCNKIDQSFD